MGLHFNNSFKQAANMSGKDRIAIFPSRGAQSAMKARLKGAQTVHSLLKKSRCFANEISLDIEEDHRHQIASGRSHERGSFLYGRSQVHCWRYWSLYFAKYIYCSDESPLEKK